MYSEAIECYNQAIKIDPNYCHAINNKGIILDDLGKYSEAIECYNKAIQINPNFTLAKDFVFKIMLVKKKFSSIKKIFKIFKIIKF
jgi:tetratricopeptide (TPR) repeat protein